jgi:hypothetical protein
MNFDIFPTILDLAALEPPASLVTRSRTLLDPEAKRVRVSEYPAVFKRPQHAVQKKNPTWDPARFARQLRSLREHSYKLIQGDDGSHELYDVVSDPHEQQDLADRHPKLAKRLTESLDSYMADLSTKAPQRSVPPPKYHSNSARCSGGSATCWTKMATQKRVQSWQNPRRRATEVSAFSRRLAPAAAASLRLLFIAQ